MTILRAFLLLLMMIGSSLSGVTLIHEPLQNIIQNQTNPVDLYLEESDLAKTTRASLFYRTQGETSFVEVDIPLIQLEAYHLEFQPLIGLQDTLEYYIQVYENGSTIATLPQDNPTRLPYKVPITKTQTTVSAPQVRLLSPQTDETSEDFLPEILLGLDDPDETIQLNKVTLTLNGSPLSDRLIRSRTFISYISQSPLPEGTHLISLTLPTTQGPDIKKTWSFTLKKTSKDGIKLSGNIQWDNRIYNTNKSSLLVNRFPFESRLSIQTTIEAEKWVSQIYTLYDNRESRYAQPLHRFQAQVQDKTKSYTLSLGDTNPKLSTLTLNGKLVRGIDVEVDALKFLGKPKKVYLRYVGGNTRRAVAVSSENAVFSGTYKQTVTGLQGTYRSGLSRHQLTYVQFKDSLSSLAEIDRGGANAQENHVISLQNQFRLFEVAQVNLETAGSVFYGNIESAEVPLSELETPLSEALLKKVTSIFPAKSSILIGMASQASVLTPLPVKGLSFVGDGKWTQPGFNTLGYSGVRKDNFEYGGYLNYRLLNNRLSLRYGLRKQNNNVLNKNVPTLFTDSNLAQLNYRVGSMGSISVGYNQSKRQNRSVTGVVTTGNAQLQNTLDSWNFNYNGLPISFWKIKGSLSSSLSFIGFNDATNDENNFTTSSYGANLSTGDQNQRLLLGINESNKREQSSLANNTIYTAYSAQYSKTLLPKKLTAFTGLRLTQGRNSGINPDRRINTQRTALSFGGSYNFNSHYYLKNGKLTLSAEYTIQSDKIDTTSNEKNFNETLITFQYSAQF